MRFLLVLAILAASLCSAGVAGADPAGSCAPYGYESHVVEIGFLATDGIGRSVTKENTRLHWNDDCYGVDPTLFEHWESNYNPALSFCGQTQTQHFEATGTGPYGKLHWDGQAKWRQGASYCGASTNVVITFSLTVDMNDQVTWAWLDSMPGSPGHYHQGATQF